MRQIMDVFKAIALAPGPASAAFVLIALFLYAFLVPLFAGDPFEMASMSIMDSFTPPLWMNGGNGHFPLGTDDQGRNLLTAMAYGLRTSLFVGLSSVVIGLVIGGGLGLVSGFWGGRIDALIMRIADVQLAYPALLLAMIINGIMTAIFGNERSSTLAITIVVMAIGLALWVQFARTIRSSVMVERGHDYVAAAMITGRTKAAIILLHILPNVMAPVLIIATINLGIAILSEATLSFLGIGIPLTHPSLGALIRNGNAYLQSGEWWISVWPCLVLAALVIAVNVIGDYLRDYFNPKLMGRGI